MSSNSCGHGPVLPEAGKRNILVTSALPYVNNEPHLGNIIGSVLSADVFARFCRSRGINTLFVGGNDEYGTTSEVRALKEKCTPRELCNKYHAIHAAVYRWFNISFDIFGRTSTDLQTQISQDIFTKLNANGYVKGGFTNQLFCQKHDAFLSDRFVEGDCPECLQPGARGDQCDYCGGLRDPLDLVNPRCTFDGAKPVVRLTKQMFLELNKLQPEIQKFTEESGAKGNWSPNGQSITNAWIKKGLQPISITRDLVWGTKVPLSGYEDKVMYSWFDACIGYISITAAYTNEWERWWRNPENVQLYQFLGKDNVVFHSVLFPGSLIGTGETWTKIHHLSTTEFLMYEGDKFSKSRGVGIFGAAASKTGVPADVWRFYLLSQRPEASDSEFTWKGFINSNNTILLNNLGNFVNRVLKFLNSHRYNDVVPSSTYHESAFDDWNNDINTLLSQYVNHLEAVRLRSGLSTAIQLSTCGNVFLQSHKLDNTLFLQNPPKCDAIIYRAINLVHLLASLLEPYLPETASTINSQLRAQPLPIPDRWAADTIKPQHVVGKAQHLFARIPQDRENEWRAAFGGGQRDA